MTYVACRFFVCKLALSNDTEKSMQNKWHARRRHWHCNTHTVMLKSRTSLPHFLVNGNGSAETLEEMAKGISLAAWCAQKSQVLQVSSFSVWGQPEVSTETSPGVEGAFEQWWHCLPLHGTVSNPNWWEGKELFFEKVFCRKLQKPENVVVLEWSRQGHSQTADAYQPGDC